MGLIKKKKRLWNNSTERIKELSQNFKVNSLFCHLEGWQVELLNKESSFYLKRRDPKVSKLRVSSKKQGIPLCGLRMRAFFHVIYIFEENTCARAINEQRPPTTSKGPKRKLQISCLLLRSLY